jgi:hypothetical protein
MSLWRQFITTLLLVAFVSGSTLAAMPLVWCMGDAGHRAIEYATSSGTKHFNHSALGGHVDEALHTASPDDGCQDWQLMGRAKPAKAPAGGLLTFDVRNVIELPKLPAIVTPAQARFWSVTTKTRIPDAQRAILRSIVLLI